VARGWDAEGRPTAAEIGGLGLAELAADIVTAP